jgi:hypothetical protein
MAKRKGGRRKDPTPQEIEERAAECRAMRVLAEKKWRKFRHDNEAEGWTAPEASRLKLDGGRR